MPSFYYRGLIAVLDEFLSPCYTLAALAFAGALSANHKRRQNHTRSQTSGACRQMPVAAGMKVAEEKNARSF
ncbi:MAG: hypothetical protein DWG76_01945 [Chloroflexi bacterium]|nr:hypothetical protein [Chloroflexota bacterium]